ncbi:MAG: DAK2 domain-containing protein, partial [Microbacterium gubbeenense]
ARTLVDGILAARPALDSTRVAVIVNGLGTTKYEELFLLWNEIRPLLDKAGLVPVEPEVGELVTSLDMGGCSLTLTWLHDQLETTWRADAYAPGYRKQTSAIARLRPATFGVGNAEEKATPRPSAAGAALATWVVEGLRDAQCTLHDNEDELGRIDAVAGDGDHGRGMVRGIDAAVRATDALVDAGPGWILRTAGRAWAADAGGTSGVLWGAGLEAAGEALTDTREAYDAPAVVDAVAAFAEAIQDLGRAEAGDKTLVDALLPFRDVLQQQIADGSTSAASWAEAARTATEAARSTTTLTPKRGRARPLAEKSLGTPDAGATSFALIVGALSARMRTAL